jgi:hypothetical protein
MRNKTYLLFIILLGSLTIAIKGIMAPTLSVSNMEEKIDKICKNKKYNLLFFPTKSKILSKS